MDNALQGPGDPGRNEDLLLEIVGCVADGRPVDWSRAESTPMSREDRALVDQLRVLESLHRVHRPDTDSTAEISTHPSVDEAIGPPPPQKTPTHWGALEIREVLGSGGFGVVYRAFDPELHADVALKVLKTPTAGTVIEEARLLARVRHPNIVSIYGAERREGEVGLWMEFVRGRTLKQILKQQGTFGAREAALVALDLTRALAAVHAAGLVHRDVKPHNVMREDSGRVVLMDFGAGADLQAFSDGQPRKYIGTPLYMAPELFDRQSPSAQTDLYSLGILLYHLVTGVYPLEGESPTSVHIKHLEGKRLRLRDVRADLPTEFVRIVERAVDPDSTKRYATAGELEADLARFVVDRGEATPGWSNNDNSRIERARAPMPATGVWARLQKYTRVREWRTWHAGEKVAIASVLILVLAGMSAVGVRVLRGGGTTDASIRDVRSLVVLPLRNASGDAAQDYFVDGMTELLTADLSGVSALRVIADSAASRYRGTKKSVQDIARELKVDGVVEGSVVRSGNRVRVTVQVVHAGTNFSVWGSSFEREASDAFTLQADIARTLVAQLRTAVTTQERDRLSQAYVTNQEAQDLYLRGRYAMHTYSRQGLAEARSLFESAVQVDPNFALAWTSLARCYALFQEYGMVTPDEGRQLEMNAASRALELNPAMYEAHSTLADALFKVEWRWTDADMHFRQALGLNPNFSMGRWQYARFLAAAGRVDDAVAEARKAEENDPLSTDAKGTVAMMLFYQRRYADAIAKADDALAIDDAQQGPHFVRGRALAAMGRLDEAIREIEEAVRLTNDQSGQLAELGRVYALAGRKADAERILAQLLAAGSGNDFVARQDAAYVQLGLGRTNEALAGLAAAVQQRSLRILWLRVDPRLDPLRTDPRFQALVQQIGGLAAP